MGKKTNFQKNQIITLDIDDITDLGFGVGRVGGAVVFVADTVPGDRIEAKIIKVNSSYLVARAEKILVRSPSYVKGRCTEGCRSCAYKCISYSEELRRKEDGVRRLFSHGELSGISVNPIVPSPEEIRYRNKAQYPVSIENGRYVVGYYAPKSHRVTPVGDCPLTPAVFSEICREVLGFLEENGISVYNEESGDGLVRHIYLRRGEVSGEILLTLVVTEPRLPESEELVRRITERFPEAVGVLLNVNRERTNVVLGDEYITLYGRDYIFDTLAGVELKITAPSFYQVNHGAAELLYAKARELAALEGGEVLLDLFCGAGSIGLSMAKDARELIGIEIVDSAVICARENAARLGAKNARFFTGDASDTEALLSSAEAELGRKIAPDVIILDPPRGGCDERLIRFVARLDPKRIVYISCNPKTLARDVVLFRALGYEAADVTPFDLFPCTGHVESVVRLERRLDVDMRR